MIYIKLLLLIVIVAQSIVFPPPLHHSLSSQSFVLIQNPCSLRLHSTVNFDTDYYFNKIVDRLSLQRKCNRNQQSLLKQSTIKIELNYNSKIKPQGYELTINHESIIIEFSQYSGYVYGLESLYQLITGDFEVPIGKITDEPVLNHRGLLIDTSRHFIQLQTLKRLIVTLPLAKLNILHLHMNDNQAFSFGSQSHPQIPKAGAYSSNQVYSHDQLKQLIDLAKKNGVNIIPEINTPTHVRSWSKSQSLKNITIQCDKYNHQLDITMDASLNLTKDLIHQIDYLFQDSPYIHLGNEPVSQPCWEIRKTAYNLFKLIHQLKTLQDVCLFWRYQIKQALPPTRKVIFYQQNIKVKSSPQDILQYTGNQNETAQLLSGTEGKIILTPRDILSLSKGFGDIFSLNGIPNYIDWRTIYFNFEIFPKGIDKSRIWGAEATVWTPMVNNDNIQNIIWMRGAVFGARAWSATTIPTHQFVQSLVGIQNTLYRLNIQAQPFTPQFCEINPIKCFPEEKVKSEIAIE